MALQMHTRRAPVIDFGDLLRLFVLSAPVAVLLLLVRNPWLDPPVQAPGFHFGIVTLAAGTAALVGLLVLVVAERLRESRAFFLGLAFCAIAGFFFIHGLLTPGVVVEQFSNGINWAPLLALFLGAICLTLSTIRPRSEESWVFRRRRRIAAGLLAAWAAFLILSLLAPRFLERHPSSFAAWQQAAAPAGDASAPEHHPAAADDEYGRGYGGAYEETEREGYGAGSEGGEGASATLGGQMHFPWLAGLVVLSTALLLLLAALRYLRTYRLSRLALHATIVAGIALLIESLFTFFFTSVWRVSWWEYHALVLLGVSTILYGVVLDYRRGASLTETISSLLLSNSVDALEHSYNEVLTGLVAAVEARDPYTKGHSDKVARLAVHIGESLGLQPERLRRLYQAGLLHDIGKIGVPDNILNKPDRLTPAEFALVKGHPVRSEEMISRIRSLRPTLKAIRWHHERLDGSGYPDALRGEQIPLEARIMAVADVFDAMRSGRSYRDALPEEEVLAYLRSSAGLVFDATCVEALGRIIAAAPEASATERPVARQPAWVNLPSPS